MSTPNNAFPFSEQTSPGSTAAPCTEEITIRCDLEYDIWSPSHFIFHIKAAHTPDQRILAEQLLTSPHLRIRDSHDREFGNRVFRFDAEPGRISLRYDARVKLLRPASTGFEQEHDITALPDEAMPFLLPSRFCPSDMLSRDAQYLFGHLHKGYSRVAAICEWIRQNIDYRIGSSGPTTTALDVYNQRAGVCRDFAHIAVTFCRGLNIPARLVVGYCHFDQPPQDFHALFEVWLGGRWIMFDPTALAEVKNIVRIGTGYDAKNTAFSTVYGAMQMIYMQIQVNHDGVAPSDDPDPIEATMRRIASMH